MLKRQADVPEHQMSGSHGRLAWLLAAGLLLVLSGCQVATYAGGPGSGTGIEVSQVPTGVAVESGGSLHLIDTANNVARAISNSSDAETVDAGNGTMGSGGDGSVAAAAQFDVPSGLDFDSHGSEIIADTGNNRIQIIAGATRTSYGFSMTVGDAYTLAGTGVSGYTGNGGIATSATLANPTGVAVDGNNNVVIADSGNNVIRVVANTSATFYGIAMTAGYIYTIAGNGTRGYSGNGSSATAAELNLPVGVFVGPSGNIGIADLGNSVVRFLSEHATTNYGIAMNIGDIYTVAGNGTAGYSGDGGVGTSAELSSPTGVAFNSDTGGIVISDPGNSVVRILSGSTVTYLGIHMTNNHIYTLVGTGTPGFSGDGGVSTSAQLRFPTGASENVAGDIFISDTGNDRVRVVSGKNQTLFGISMTKGDIYTVAGNGTKNYSGDGFPATGAELSDPNDVALSNGNLAVADSGNSGIRLMAGATGTAFGVSMSLGDIYTIAGNGASGYSGDGGAGASAELDFPTGVAGDASGNVVVADTGNNAIRVIADTSGSYFGRSMTAGHIYALAGDGTGGYSGDGSAATSGELLGADAVTVDGFGNALIADTGNDVIRMVAENTGIYYGVSATAGDIYTIAGNNNAGYSGDGGSATGAELNVPSGVVVDSAGNVIIGDSANDAVRVIAGSTGTFFGQSMVAGDIYTVGGDGTSGYSGDNGSGTLAELDDPNGLAVDSVGNVVVADSGNNVVRIIADASGSDDSVSMTAGDIYTVAGNGTAGFFGDGGSTWTSAELNEPLSVATGGSGTLFVADSLNNRIREFS